MSKLCNDAWKRYMTWHISFKVMPEIRSYKVTDHITYKKICETYKTKRIFVWNKLGTYSRKHRQKGSSSRYTSACRYAKFLKCLGKKLAVKTYSNNWNKDEKRLMRQSHETANLFECLKFKISTVPVPVSVLFPLFSLKNFSANFELLLKL